MARQISAATPHKVRGFWYLVRRVPLEFAPYDQRNPVRVSTGLRIADDPRGIRAAQIVGKLDADLIRYWDDKRRGRDPDAAKRYERAVAKARHFGLSYIPTADLTQGPVSEIVTRAEVLEQTGAETDREKTDAVLGGVSPPKIMASDLLERLEDIEAASLSKKSKNQLRKWRKARQTPLDVFIGLVGDKAIGELTRADVLKLQGHWKDKVLAGEINTASANKYIRYVKVMFDRTNEDQQLNLPPVFDRATMRGEKYGQRLAYDPEFVQKHFLADGALDRLNDEARRIVYVMIETGLRIAEVTNLTENTIHLGGDIPYVEVLPEDREMKTEQSARKIPLVGCALMALKEHPRGFPRYRDKNDTLSANVNSFLTDHALRPKPKHSLYSLRHTFEDRLTAIEPPEKVMAVLMGHEWSRPRYGVGPSLEQLKSWLDRIAFKPPSAV